MMQGGGAQVLGAHADFEFESRRKLALCDPCPGPRICPP